MHTSGHRADPRPGDASRARIIHRTSSACRSAACTARCAVRARYSARAPSQAQEHASAEFQFHIPTLGYGGNRFIPFSDFDEQCAGGREHCVRCGSCRRLLAQQAAPPVKGAQRQPLVFTELGARLAAARKCPDQRAPFVGAAPVLLVAGDWCRYCGRHCRVSSLLVQCATRVRDLGRY